jgi:O-antigen/teichoic acid export membrane protein
MPGSSWAVSVANLALRVTTMLGRFVLLLAMASYLSPAQVGLFALFSAASLWGVYFHGLEFYLFNLREIVAGDRELWARRTRDAFALYGVVFVAATAVWIAVFQAGLLPWALFGWFLAILALEQIAQESYRLLNVFGRPLAGSVVLFARSGCWMYVLAGVMVATPSARDLMVVLAAWTAGAASSVLLAAWYMRDLHWRGLPRVDWPWLRRGLGVVLPLLVGSLAFRGIAVFERAYLGSVRGGSALGVFGFYATIAGALPVLAESGVGAVLYPKMMKAWQLGDLDGYRRRLRQLCLAFAAFLLVSVPAALIAVAMAVGRLRDPIYASSFTVFVILVAAAGVLGASAVPQYALWARKRDRTMIAIPVAGLGAVIGLDLALIPRHGVMGAAWGQLGGMLLILVLRVGALIAAHREGG